MACQPTGAANASPVYSPAPTTLVTLPPAVLLRSLANRSGIAFGMSPRADTEPVTIWPNSEPAYRTALTGPTVGYTIGGEIPR